MTQVECKTRKIGGSIGIILPKEFVAKENIKPNQELRVEIKKHVKVKDVWGLLPDWKTPTQKLKDEARKGW
ncbi:MAG: AbrB/MazE/SpoVT family DNA-binding domain-containing protein [Candidatus Aenigmarchaeota archaeon]|nr:AbrB/MazE/SpoVT family DNA-binding domain-containing protein [Candidatus Aenigmarchaeota archaeon]